MAKVMQHRKVNSKIKAINIARSKRVLDKTRAYVAVVNRNKPVCIRELTDIYVSRGSLNVTATD